MNNTIELDSGSWSDRIWPIGITIALLIVVAVNIGFIFVAVSGADDVAESYESGHR